MSLVLKLAGTTIPARAVKAKGRNEKVPGGVDGFAQAAWYGETPATGFYIDDPFGEYESILMQPWVTFTADETACSRPRLFTGWLTARRISRGGYKSGPGRVWDCEVRDLNALWSFVPFRAQSAQRPAETDLARAAFVRASAPMAWTPVADNGLWNTTDNPINFDVANFVGQFPVNAMESFAGIAGKNFYALWDHDNDEIQGFYDLVTACPIADMKVSNFRAEYDPSPGIGDPAVFWPMKDAELYLDPQNYYTEELLNYRGSYAWAERQATIDATEPSALSPTGLHRGIVRSTDRIGQLSTALSVIAADLERYAQEEGSITISVPVPNTHVNMAEAGYALPLHLSHIPGFEDDFVNIPIIRRNVVPYPGRRDMYIVHFECNAGTKLASEPGGGPPGVFVPPRAITCDADDIAIVQSEHHTLNKPTPLTLAGSSWPAPPVEGNLLVCAWTSFSHSNDIAMAGWTKIGTKESFVGGGGSGGTIQVFYKVASASEATTPTGDVASGAFSSNTSKSQNYLIEIAGVDTLDVFDQDHSETPTTTPGFTLTPTAGIIGLILTVQELSTDFIGTPTADVDAVLYVEGNIVDSGNPGRWLAYKVIDGASGSYNVNRTLGTGRSWNQYSIAFKCSGSDSETLTCMLTGVWSDWIFLQDGDGTTTDFTIPCPYADGGLRVKVDGLEIQLGLEETDPAGGDFSLDFAPKAAIGDSRAEKVYYKYQGR